MQIIQHRVNNLKKLKSTNKNYGIEVDIRYHNNDIILCHDALNHHNNACTKFSDMLEQYDLNGPIILNLKTTGVEEVCANLMQKYNIKNWFFLDMISPTFLWSIENKTFDRKNIAIRCSEYETSTTAIAFKAHAQWIWLDCFSGKINIDDIKKLKQSGFKICLVSPELQNYPQDEITKFKQKLKNIKVDAICTKNGLLWAEVE